MEFSYQQLLVDVRRYKYRWDEGFSVLRTTRHQLSWEDARAMERLAERVSGDMGINWTMAMRGILYSATARNKLRQGVFTEIVGCQISD